MSEDTNALEETSLIDLLRAQPWHKVEPEKAEAPAPKPAPTKAKE